MDGIGFSLLSCNFILHKSRVINIHLFAARKICTAERERERLDKLANFTSGLSTCCFGWERKARSDNVCENWERVFIKGTDYSRGKRRRHTIESDGLSLKASTCQMLKLGQKERWELCDIYGIFWEKRICKNVAPIPWSIVHIYKITLEKIT